MILACAFSNVDWEQARDLFTWAYTLELNKTDERHICLLIASRGMDPNKVDAVMLSAKRAYKRMILIVPPKVNETGWPTSCNYLFQTAVKWVAQLPKAPFFWCEPDCIPLKRGWLDKIEREYDSCAKPFMGTVYTEPFPHLSGCAVYPANIRQYNPDCLMPDLQEAWDCVAQEKTLPHTATTDILQHVWGNQTNNIAPTFPNQRSLNILSRKAVIFHRNKDGTLIKRLLERKTRPLKSLIARFRDPDLGNGFQQFHEYDHKAEKRVCHNVTLVSIDGTKDARKSLRALISAGNQMAFDQVLLLAFQRPAGVPPWIECKIIPQLDLNGYNRFCMVELHKYINTSHSLVVHADSGINNADAWKDEWLQYDFAGAPWPAGWAWDINPKHFEYVGNSGFVLRSKRFLEATVDLPTDHVIWHGKRVNRCVDDVACCINFRRELVLKRKMRFMPPEIAAEFAFEQPTEFCERMNGQFGFHRLNI